MFETLADLQPSSLWKHFAAISALPRDGRGEASLARYATEVGARAGSLVRRVRGGGLLVKSPARPGHERAPSICLETHIDILSHAPDALASPGEGALLGKEGDAIAAPHGLVAADQALVFAAMLALVDDPGQIHGPLELLASIDGGAGLPLYRTMAPELTESSLVLKLESERQGALTFGTLGKEATIGQWKLLWEDVHDKDAIGLLRISGLRGGHLDRDVDKYRGNAIKILARILLPLHERGVRIASLGGGGRRQALPSEAEALISIPHKKLPEIQELIGQLEAIVSRELKESDPGFKLGFALHSFRKAKVIKRVQIRRILHVIHAMPQGVLRMSSELPGLVQTATQLAALASNRKSLILSTVQSSLARTELEACSSSVASLFDIGGAAIEQHQIQAAFRGQPESAFSRLAESCFEAAYGYRAPVCTLRNEADPEPFDLKDREVISFGPPLSGGVMQDNAGRLDIAAAERFGAYLRRFVQAVGERGSSLQLH